VVIGGGLLGLEAANGLMLRHDGERGPRRPDADGQNGSTWPNKLLQSRWKNVA
jgi:hypothetical protein